MDALKDFLNDWFPVVAVFALPFLLGFYILLWWLFAQLLLLLGADPTFATFLAGAGGVFGAIVVLTLFTA